MENNSFKILVVDDLQDNLITLNALIKDAFPEALTLNAKSGKKGLELAAKENPDVILLDILMPGMDGYEVCHKLKADKELCDIPVVFVTAIENNKKALVKALESGGEAFLTKPIDEIELTAQIRSMLKIREANEAKKDEKVRLEKLVEERSKELVKELDARKQAQEKLLESESKFRLMTENSIDIIWQMDLKLSFTYTSPSVELMFGFTQEEWTGSNLASHATRRQFFKMARVALNGIKTYKTFKQFRFEAEMLHKDGSSIPVEIMGRLIKNEKGIPIGLQGSTRDITERKQAEEELKESEEKHRLYFEHAPLSYQSLNEEGFILNVNQTWLKLLAYDREEVIGKWFGDFLHPGQKEVFRKLFPENIKRKDIIRDVIFLLKNKNGNYISAEYTAKIGFDEQGNFVQTHCLFQDITERKQAEEKLKESDTRMRNLFNAMHDIVFEMDYNGTYLNIAPTSPELMVKPAEEMTGKTLHDAFPKQQADIFLQFIKNCIDKNKPDKIIYPIEFENKTIWFEGRANPIGTKRLLFIASDISERKRAEKKLFESKKLLSTIAENFPNSYLSVINSDFTIGLTSGQELKKQNIDPKQFEGLKIDQIFGDKTEFILEKYKKTFRGEEQTFEIFFNDQHQLYKVVPLFADDGSVPQILSVVENITERKQAEEKLRESETMLRKAEQIAHIGSWKMDPVTRETVNSDELYKIFDVLHGSSFEETIKKIHPDDFNHVVEISESAIATKKPYRVDYRIVLQDNSIRYAETIGEIVCDTNGEVKEINGTVQDITERKQAEEALRESELKVRNIFENSTNLFYSHTIDHVLIYLSPQVKNILGYTQEEAMGKWTEFASENPINEIGFNNTIKAIETGKRQPTYELELVRKDGKLIVVEVNESPLVKDGKTIAIVGSLTDITERKQAEESLKESEEKFKTIVENGSVLLTLTDSLGRIEFASPQCESVIGWKEEDIIGVNMPDFIHPDDKLRVAAERKKVTTQQAIKDLEYRIIDKENKIRWVSHSAAIIKKDDAISILSTITNITDRKQAEEANKELLKRFELIGLHLPGVIYQFRLRTDGTFHFPYASHGIKSIYGVTPEEVEHDASNAFKAIHPDDLERVSASINHSAQTLNPWHDVYRINQTSGKTIWVEGNSTPVKLEDGSIIWHGFIQDITERKLIEESLLKSEERFELAMKASNDGLFDWNLLTNEIYYSPAWKKIIGYEDHELPNDFSVWETTTSPDDVKKSWELQQKLISKQIDRFVLEFKMKHKDGHWVDILSQANAIFDDKGKARRIVGTHTDITERKQVEQELIAAKEKAEESNRLKTAFLNNMSHEIRTPLNGITGFIGLLQDSEIDNEAKQHYFDIINKSSDRLIATVTDIIDVSRIEAGLVNVSKTEVSVNEILKEQYRFFKREVQSKGLELIYKPGLADNEARFVTDKHKLEGILTNLIKNAIKFTDQGEITFACSLKKEQEIEVLEFYVKDTGIGIPANRLDAIFNRFEQADIEDTRVHQGSGLGLAIAKSYVEMLGGKISVKSKEGEGSTFTFSLPYTKQLEKESDAKENINREMQIALSNLSVIIAEDDEISKMFFDAIFKNEFKKITYSKTGKETIDLCRKNPETDLILMDIKMPGINGYDATREIRKFDSKVVIIAQTAYGFPGDREKALEVGCNGYIAKPIKKDELLALILNAFNK